MKIETIYVIGVLLSFLLFPAQTFAKSTLHKKDTNGDGKIDQIIHLDSHDRIIKLDLDKDGDGVLETFQYYEAEQVVRLERDSDADGRVDSWDDFKEGRRIQHRRRSNKTGKIDMIIVFDAEERPSEVKKDTSGDGVFDSFYHYTQGQLTLLTKDTDGDSKPNILQTYKDDKPQERRVDQNGNGHWERVTLFDEEGLVRESRHDANDDGIMDEFRTYHRGEIQEQKKDRDQDGRFEAVTRYVKGLPAEQRKDSNGDGHHDVITRFKKGTPFYQEKDSNFDDRMDFFSHFDAQGLAEKVEEDTRHTGRIDRVRYYKKGIPVRVTLDGDGDGFHENVTILKRGKLHLQSTDRNRDGKPDTRIFFNAKEKKERIESDTDLDGRSDTWEFYGEGDLSRIEKDDNGDGKVDLKIFYHKGKKQKLLRDQNGDGHFELSRRFDLLPWSHVTTMDEDGDGRPEAGYYYRNGVIRLKEIDGDDDGTPDLKEHYNESGKLCKSEENEEGTGGAITWFYNEAEEAIRAEKDRNGDKSVDTWFFYDKGKLIRVEEDTNGNGNVDLWEYYDESEALVKRSKDLNLDGVADIEEVY